MAHRFDTDISLGANGAPLATGPVEPKEEEMFRIWVWVTQKETGAAARGSRNWSANPKSPNWNCGTRLFKNSPPFAKGPALGMAVALVKKPNGKEYFGWWDGKVKIV
jgi:hypothetical protein